MIFAGTGANLEWLWKTGRVESESGWVTQGYANEEKKRPILSSGNRNAYEVGKTTTRWPASSTRMKIRLADLTADLIALSKRKSVLLHQMTKSFLRHQTVQTAFQSVQLSTRMLRPYFDQVLYVHREIHCLVLIRLSYFSCVHQTSLTN